MAKIAERLERANQKLSEKRALPANRGKISNTEWGIVIGVLIVIDAIQIVLDLFVVGLIANRIIDVAVAFLFGFYLQVRGQSFRNVKRLISFLGSAVGEFLPVVDIAPLWSLDGFYNMSLDKAERALEKVPGVKTVNNVINARNRFKGNRVPNMAEKTEEKIAA